MSKTLFDFLYVFFLIEQIDNCIILTYTWYCSMFLKKYLNYVCKALKDFSKIISLFKDFSIHSNGFLCKFGYTLVNFKINITVIKTIYISLFKIIQ